MERIVRNSKSCSGLERPKERGLFLWSLERAVLYIQRCRSKSNRDAKWISTYTELGRRVDELEVDLLEIPTRRVNHKRLADGDDTLLGSRNRTFQHEVVVLDDTVVGEATHGRDLLLGDIMLSGGVGVIVAAADTVDLLVELRTVVVTVYIHLLANDQVAGKLKVCLL